MLRVMFIAQGMESLDFSRVDWDARNVAGSASDVMAACDTLPMMSERRVVLVPVSSGDEKSLGFADAKPLAKYLGDMPATTLLVMVSTSIPKTSALYKSFAANGKAYEFTRLDRPDLTAFVKSRFKREGVIAPPNVVGEIIKVSGYFDREPRSDLFGLGSDIANIIGYAKGGGAAAPEAGKAVEITLADVAACMGTSIETDVFAMLDAVSSGRKGDAIELIRNITARGENAFGLLALLTGQFEIMLGYREMKDRRAQMGEIMETLGVKSEFRLRKAAGFADRYSAGHLAELLHRLYRVDRDIKSGLYGERLALTMFVAEM
jgi:DNA polymerase-3 subunit delta